MFKASQKLRLNTSRHHGNDGIQNAAPNNSNNYNNIGEHECIFGKYQRTPDADAYPIDEHRIFIAPELTDLSKVQLLHFPNGILRKNSEIRFIIKRNGVKGNFEVKLESPEGVMHNVPLKSLDPERLEVTTILDESGLYKVHIKCNSVALPPSIIITSGGCSEISSSRKSSLSDFELDEWELQVSSEKLNK